MQALVGSLVVVEVEVAFQASGQGRYSRVVVEIDVLILDSPPKPLNEDVVKGPATTVHADLDARRFQAVSEGMGSELGTLVGAAGLIAFPDGEGVGVSVGSQGDAQLAVGRLAEGLVVYDGAAAVDEVEVGVAVFVEGEQVMVIECPILSGILEIFGQILALCKWVGDGRSRFS
jgi:hypothetical protein